MGARWSASCATIAAVVMLAPLLPRLTASTPQLTAAQRIAIIQALVAEVGIARHALPPDKKGIEIDPAGQILNAEHVQKQLQSADSARVGDRVAVTGIEFKDDAIVFEINGGPHKTHWYDHISLGMGGTAQPVVTSNQKIGPHGAIITVHYEHGLPALTPAQVKHDLSTLIDWDPPAKAAVMVQPLPASVKTAINEHKVLVGMTRDMVVAALGRTGNKSGETDAQGRQVEDWVYGAPPEDTTFVRFYNDRVLQVTIYKADGQKLVETQPDPALEAGAERQQQRAAQRAEEAAQPAPTLRRPGDAPAPTLNPGQMPPPQQPPTGPPAQRPPATTPPGQTFPPVCCGGA
jgi:hypothetical protein